MSQQNFLQGSKGNIIQLLLTKAQVQDTMLDLSINGNSDLNFSTDISVKNKMAVVLVYWDGKYNVELLDLLRCLDASAAGLTESLISLLDREKIDKTKMVGFSGDTCNVMFGERNSVAQKLRDMIPGILTVKCACHSIHLCSCKAFAKLPTKVRNEKYLVIDFLCKQLYTNIANYVLLG